MTIDLDLELELENLSMTIEQYSTLSMTIKCSNLNGMLLPMLLAFACPELHLGAVRLLGHGQLVDLQVDLANLEDPALG